jgi:hypothetical protein
METARVLTLHLALLIGLYETAAGIAGVSGRVRWTELLDEFDRSQALTFMTGFVVFALGATMVLVHSLWTDSLAAIVTLIGWAALIEGLLMLVLPGALLALSRPLVRYQRGISIAALLFGAFMLIAGLTGHAAATL